MLDLFIGSIRSQKRSERFQRSSSPSKTKAIRETLNVTKKVLASEQMQPIMGEKFDPELPGPFSLKLGNNPCFNT